MSKAPKVTVDPAPDLAIFVTFRDRPPLGFDRVEDALRYNNRHANAVQVFRRNLEGVAVAMTQVNVYKYELLTGAFEDDVADLVDESPDEPGDDDLGDVARDPASDDALDHAEALADLVEESGEGW